MRCKHCRDTSYIGSLLSKFTIEMETSSDIFSGMTGGYFYFKFISSDRLVDSQVVYNLSRSSDIFILLTFNF